MKFKNLESRLKQAMAEDRAQFDRTTHAIPGYQKEKISAWIKAKQSGVFCGAFLLRPTFRLLDRNVGVKIYVRDGQKVKAGAVIAKLSGTAKGILGAERIFLNLASRLSGVASLTKEFSDQVKDFETKILDTRKTTPLWRDLEKFAVLCGGGHNHRFSLEDAILIKDNHLAFLRKKNLAPVDVYKPALKKKIKFLEIEAQTKKDVWEGIKMKADVVMLDNMTTTQVKDSITFISAAKKALNVNTPLVEVSGGVTKKNVRKLAKLGVDQISIGALTHSPRALDLSLEVH